MLQNKSFQWYSKSRKLWFHIKSDKYHFLGGQKKKYLWLADYPVLGENRTPVKLSVNCPDEGGQDWEVFADRHVESTVLG